MHGVCCWDDDQISDHAHNVYQCEECGALVQERVAKDSGITAIYPDGTVEAVARPSVEVRETDQRVWYAVAPDGKRYPIPSPVDPKKTEETD
jgi:hypothetical protein